MTAMTMTVGLADNSGGKEERNETSQEQGGTLRMSHSSGACALGYIKVVESLRHGVFIYDVFQTQFPIQIEIF